MRSRSQVVQGLLDMYDTPSYLEVGVNRGVTFNAVNALRKVAVDPKFLFDTTPHTRSSGQSSVNFHEVTSDTYFSKIIRPDDMFDVVYLDGLHTFEQTTRDLLNALRYLSRNGVILIDDVLPSNYEASLPDTKDSFAVRAYTRGTDPSWMGDVYKLAFFIDSFMQQVSFATTADNHGQLVIWPQPRSSEAVGQRTFKEIGGLGFVDVVRSREVFNLKPSSEIFKLIRDGIHNQRYNIQG